MPSGMRRSLFNAFRQFPLLNFIVKYERNFRSQDDDEDEYFKPKQSLNYSSVASEVQQVLDNVFLAKWIPQMDLIAHPQCFGIITHGGWSSVLEAVFYARPLILMPLFADHFKNAKVIEYRKLGVLVDKQAIQLNTFTNALQQIVNNERFLSTSIKYSKMLREYVVEFSSPQQLIRHELRQISKDIQLTNSDLKKSDHCRHYSTNKCNYNETRRNKFHLQPNINMSLILGCAARNRWQSRKIPKSKSIWTTSFIDYLLLIFIILLINMK